MKKNIFFLSFLFGVIIPGALYAQGYSFLLENSDFEQWEVPPGLDSTLMEPLNWSSLKTSDNQNLSNLAPVVMQLTPDAHTGNFSVHLHNEWNSFINMAVVGVLTNGRVHAEIAPGNRYIYTDTTDARWNSRIDSRPDSLTGWFKWHPAGGDTLYVKLSLHVGYFRMPARQVDSANLVGSAIFYYPSDSVKEWTRFAVPVHYYDDRTPAYYLCILNSGNGTHAVKGSQAWFDDLHFVYKDIPENAVQLTNGNLKVYASFGNIHIRMEKGDPAGYDLLVTDILGRQITRNRLQAGNELRVTPDRPGIYIVRIYHGQEVYTRKVMVKE